MNRLIAEIFEQASLDNVVIDDDTFNINFNTIVYNNKIDR